MGGIRSDADGEGTRSHRQEPDGRHQSRATRRRWSVSDIDTALAAADILDPSAAPGNPVGGSQPNTVGSRDMSCLSAPSGRNSSPVVVRPLADRHDPVAKILTVFYPVRS